VGPFYFIGIVTMKTIRSEPRSPQALALALEGVWNVEFSGAGNGISAATVSIENRALIGKGRSHTISGDFRINDERITFFIRVLKTKTKSVDDVMLCVSGDYMPDSMKLYGELLGVNSMYVSVRMRR